MIVFYTRYNVQNCFDIKALLGYTFDCVTGMRNVPDMFKNLSWNGENSGEWKLGRDCLSFEIDSDARIIAVRISILDQNEELWTMDIALDEKIHEIQLRLAREKKIVSADYDRHFNVPYLFKKFVRDGIGGTDYNLQILDRPVHIDESNIEIIADIINGNLTYSLPVIFVSHPFYKAEYELDANELAKDMAGSAHILVEMNSSISPKLRELTCGKNAYNGAIDIFYNDDVFRYIKSPEITPNQFRYKIAHAVYTRMAMRNIDDESSLNAIRLRNKIKKLDDTSREAQRLELEVERLKAKCKDDAELIEYILGENKILEKKANELENSNYELQSKVSSLNEALNRKNGCSGSLIKFDFTEKEFYEDEIKRIVLECIRSVVSNYGNEEKSRRDYHVLSNILEKNTVSEIGGNIKKEMLHIFRKERLSKSDITDLKGIGFEVQNGGHTKCIFHGDDRYIVTVACTPSDHREGENLAHEAVNLIFGRY